MAQSLPSCIQSANIVQNHDIDSNLIANGWSRCFFEGYSQVTTMSSVLNSCPIDDDIFVFVGAISTSNSTSASLGAYAPSSVLSTITASKYKAEIPLLLEGTGYNVYWYNYYQQAFGFAPSSGISLTSPYGGDTQDHTSGKRLSWSTIGINFGGYRAV